jgi:hypothetical protein
LVLALLGGFISVKVLDYLKALCLSMENYSFHLIAAMAGNVVQSSAIIVQGLAKHLSGSYLID